MRPFLTERYGNPSSIHAAGRSARQGVDEARRQLAALLAVHDSQIIFTSGGTEANHMAIFGQAARCGFRGHLVTSTIEHPSVFQVFKQLQHHGMEVTWVGVDRHGSLRPEAVVAALRADTVLVSIMHANNETGIIQPLAEISQACHAASPTLVVHSDAIQSVGKIPVLFESLGVDMLSLSAHKLGGPKGVGALVMAKQMAIDPWLVGGGQERGRRAGTENVPGIVGCGAAAQWVQETLTEEMQRVQQLQQRLERAIQENLPDTLVLGQQAEARLPNTTALALPGIHGETVVINLDLAGYAVSSGSACSSGHNQPSHVPTAMGVAPDLATGMVRISLGWNTTQQEVEHFITRFIDVIKRLQHLSGPRLHG